MKEFSWKYFCTTGQIDAYLLYKDFKILDNTQEVKESDVGYVNE